MIKSVHIKDGKTLGDTWFQLLSELWVNGRRGVPIDEGSHKGEQRMEFDMVSGISHYPHERPLAPIVPPSCSIVTVNDDAIQEYFNEYLMNPTCLPNEEYRYAIWINRLIMNHFTDSFQTQIEWIINHFMQKGYGNNHCYLSVGDEYSNFRYDAPYKNETERKTSPCLRGLDFKIKDGQLLMGVIYRSWDLFGGWPENMGGFTLLNEYVCDHLDGVEPGPMCFFSMGLHCYTHQIKAVMDVLNIKVEKG